MLTDDERRTLEAVDFATGDAVVFRVPVIGIALNATVVGWDDRLPTTWATIEFEDGARASVYQGNLVRRLTAAPSAQGDGLGSEGR